MESTALHPLSQALSKDYVSSLINSVSVFPFVPVWDFCGKDFAEV